MLDLILGLIEDDQVLKDGSAFRAAELSAFTEVFCETLADGHEMTEARKRCTMMAYLVGFLCSAGTFGLILLVLPERFEPKLSLPS